MGNQNNILVTGANGQLGMEVRTLEKKYPGYNFIFTTKEDLSITDYDLTDKFFSMNNFTHCINCAAYTAVDKAESEKELAIKINAEAPGRLSAICKKYKTKIIHISTDYVFDGNADIPYKETDQTNPVNIYGSSKLQGEQNVMKENDEAIIIRSSWIYSSYGKNFVKTMLRLMKEKDRIAVVNDQLGGPTYAADLAEAIIKIISFNKSLPGIYNYCNRGIISWYQFALEIKSLINSKCEVMPITTAEYPTPAKRPRYSGLDTTKIQKTFDLIIPGWADSLKSCIKAINNNQDIR